MDLLMDILPILKKKGEEILPCQRKIPMSVLLKKFCFRCPPQSVAPCGALPPSEGTLKTNCILHNMIMPNLEHMKIIMAEYRNQKSSRYSPQGVRALQCSSTVMKE